MTREIALKLTIVTQEIKLVSGPLAYGPINFLSLINFKITIKIPGKTIVFNACEAVKMNIIGMLGIKTIMVQANKQKPIIE